MKMKVVSFAVAGLAAIISCGCGNPDLQITTIRSSSLAPASGYVLLSAEGDTPAVATDLNGKIVWKYEFDTHSNNYHPIPIQPLPNGDLILQSATGAGIAPCSDCPQFNTVSEIDT